MNTGHDGSTKRIIYADSSDGKSWSNFQMVVDKGARVTVGGSCTVIV